MEIEHLKEDLKLTPQERVIESYKLLISALKVARVPQYKPFYKIFNSWNEYEKWRKTQRNPLLR